MRNLSDDLWDDEWFGSLDPISKIIWIGLLTKVADDQGRILDNSNLIKSKLFPICNEPTAYDIGNTLAFFIADEKLISYSADGKACLQIKNWWKYQSGAAWMGKSKYPAPEGWTDCYQYRVRGGGIDKSDGWDSKISGYQPIHQPIPQPLGVSNPKEDFYLNVNVNIKEKRKRKEKGATATALQSFNQNASHAEAERILCGASGLPAIPTDAVKYLDTVTGLITEYGLQPVKDALAKSKIRWCQTPRKTGGGTYSVLNFAWVDWAMALLSGQDTENKPVGKVDPFESLINYMEDNSCVQ